MSGDIFVDRKKELEDIKKFYEMSLRGTIGGIIIYGWRKVGKSTLVDKFLESVQGFRVNCAWISDPRTFSLVVIEKLRSVVGDHEILKNLRIYTFESADPMLVLRQVFDTINLVSARIKGKLVVALDEIHKFLSKVATRIARETKKSKDIVYNDILWMLKDVVEQKKVFCIFMASIGWIKLREVLEVKKVKENPLLGLLIKYEIEPFGIDATKQLVLARNNNIPNNVIEEIHRISGGIPLLVDIISTLYKPNTELLDLVLDIMRRGLLDEFFENLIKFIAETMKRDYTVVIGILKTFRDTYITPEIAAKNAHIDRTSAYVILEELYKCGILKKEKSGREVRYEISYPLISIWLDTRIEPQRKIFEILASKLGITAEYYAQELLKKFEGKELSLYDDEKGTYLLGTAGQVRYRIKRVYSLDKTAKILGHKNADLLIELEENELLLVEIKAKIRDIEPRDIIQLDNARKWMEEKTKKKIHAVMMLIGIGKATLPAIREAITRGITIVSAEGIKLLAKHVNMPYY